jgi:thiol-disulfide isomerase/thioredoxin
MRCPLVAAVLILIAGAATAFAQSANPSEGLGLLNQAAQEYTDAKSYYIESVEERTSSNEYSHSWQKTVITAAETSENRFHFEGRSSTGSGLKIADGKTVWTYRADEHRYTAKPQLMGASSQPAVMGMSEMAMWSAENLRKNLGVLAKSFKSAQRLPDANLIVNGHEVSCDVVRVQNSDQRRVSPNYTFEKTIWIDKAHRTFVKTAEHAHTYLLSDGGPIPIEEEVTTTFTTTELNGPVRDGLFTFVPPSDAKLIQDFPDPRNSLGGTLTGDQVPSLKLKSADGKVVALDSFRGKPVLLDFWATWCGPCIAALPRLAQIYQEAKDKGLVLLTVDQDEEPDTADKFLAKKGYTWPNFHDGDGQIEKLVGAFGIPRTMLVDAQGKITYDGSGVDEEQLRTAIVKLGQEYAVLSPKQAPCAVSK